MDNNDAGRAGTEYQINLSALIALQALSSHDEKWRLSTENKLAGKFDDIVFESGNGGNVFLMQCKHKIEKVLQWRKLLQGYYNSYKEIIIKSFEPELLILCSNNGPSKSDFFDEELLKIDIFPEKIRSFKFKNSNTKEVQKILNASDDHSLKFCEIFRFFHIPDSAIEDGIENKLKDAQDIFGLEFSKYHFMQKIDRCFQGKLGMNRQIEKSHVIAFLYDWQSQDYLKKLDSFKTNFEKSYDFKENKISNIVSANDHFLNLLKIHRSLLTVPSPSNNNQPYKKNQLLFIHPRVGCNILDKIIVSFELPEYCIIVISINNSDQFLSVKSRINDIIIKQHYKRVIILSKVPIQDDVIQDEIKFTDLTAACQNTLLSKEVNFQGKDLPIKELISNSVKNIDSIINQETIIDLINGENIKIGTAFRELGEIEPYYIKRKFVLGMKEFTEQDVCKFIGQSGKFILISGGAGMGKTTVLTKLGCLIKKTYPHIFLIRVDLNMLTSIFEKFQKARKKLIHLEDILRYGDKNYFMNSFEQNIFSNTKNNILMVDAVDEISPKYTSLVGSFVLRTSKRKNIAKIFVTTRPHLKNDLEKFLKTRSYQLLPFSGLEQTDFLMKYWKKNLRKEDYKNRIKCEIYAKKLISKIRDSIGHTSWNIIGIPLQTIMIAEIFQGSNDKKNEWVCLEEFLLTENGTLELPDKLNITRLYDMFVEKKKEIFINDKGNTQGNVITQDLVAKQYEDAQNEHQKLAARLLLNANEYSLMDISKSVNNISNETIIKMGMLENIGDELLFVHQTFAEYFLAKAMWAQLKGMKKRNKFLLFLLKSVFMEGKFEVIRAFFEGILTNEHSQISKKIFKICGSTVDSITWRRSRNINHLASEGRENILKLMLEKSQNSYDVFANHTESTFNHWRSILLRLWLRIRKRKKLLNIVHPITGRTALSEAFEFREIIELFLDKGADVNQRDGNGCTILHYAAMMYKIELVNYLVRTGAAINVADDEGNTPLHNLFRDSAALEGHLDCLKFLVDRGGDVNIKNKYGETILHLAAVKGTFDCLKFLVDTGGDVNIQNGYGETPLHLAAKRDNLDRLKILVDSGGDVNIQNRFGKTPLHSAAETGHLDCLKFLVDRGGDVNIQNEYGGTPLHLAAKWGNLDCLKFLVDSGGDVNILNERGHSVLDSAVPLYRVEIVKYLHDRRNIEIL